MWKYRDTILELMRFYIKSPFVNKKYFYLYAIMKCISIIFRNKDRCHYNAHHTVENYS